MIGWMSLGKEFYQIVNLLKINICNLFIQSKDEIERDTIYYSQMIYVR